MEDVLTVYGQGYDEAYPQVCLDEKVVELHADVVEPLRCYRATRASGLRI